MPYDTQEQINTCLSCKRKTCTGDCYSVRQAAPPNRAYKPGSRASRLTAETFAPVLAGEKTMVQLARETGVSISMLYDCRDRVLYGIGGKRI